MSQLVPEDALLEQGLDKAQSLASGAINAMGGVRNLLLGSFAESYEGQLEQEVEHISQAADRSEAEEGIAAFLSKRKPDFSGLA